jgi:hypothetical protein
LILRKAIMQEVQAEPEGSAWTSIINSQ